MPPGLEKKLLDTAHQEGEVKVIVGLDLPGKPFQYESNLPEKSAVGQQRAAIAKAQQDIQNELLPYNAKTRRTYVTLPYMSLSVSVNALEHLLRSPRVTSIEEVQVYEPTLQSTGQWIGSSNTWAANFDGEGSSVAIIDTGIDANHPFFGGGGPNGNVQRVVDEACFSTNDGNTLCPNGNGTQYGSGAADVVNVANCYVGAAVGTGNPLCDHGTHVAGIAAGQDEGTRGYDGVAPKAGIVAIQAAHRVADCDDDETGNQPCVRFFSDDTIAGMDWVRVYSDTYTNVAAVNMSLGGGFHFQPCTGAAERTAVQNLRTAGIATAIAAGNNGWTWATGSPGCIPEAVTVGSVWDTDATLYTGNPAPDDVLHNMAYWVDLMAVGAGVDSSIPDDAWGNGWFGTSMATPQVTGAFAVIQSIDPAKSVGDIEALLKSTGDWVQDQRAISPTLPFPAGDGITYPNPCDQPECQPRTGQSQPRLQLDDAVAAITWADLDISKDCKPDGIKPVGENALCHITVRNNGNWAAMAVQMVDTYVSDGSQNFTLGTITVSPSGAGSCSATSNPQNPKGKVTCDLGGMLKDAVVEITVPVRADQPLNVNDEAVVTALTPDPNLANNKATDGLNFGLATANVVVTKTCKPTLQEEPFHVGDETRGKVRPYCEIIATNHGPAAARDVVLQDRILATGEFSIDGISYGGTTCAPGSGGPFTQRTITCTSVPSLAKDASISLGVIYNATQAVAINDTAEVTTEGSHDPEPGNNQATGSVQILSTADLSITKVDAPDPVKAGENLIYTLTVNNAGPSPAEAVVITDLLPAGVQLVGTPTTTVGNCGVGTTTCNLGTLASGASAIITIEVKVLPETRGQLENSANVTSATYDPNNSNNSATAGTTVNAEADIAVLKTRTSAEVVAGAQIAYQVVVRNDGPSTATGVVLTDVMPAYTSLVSAQATTGETCTPNQTTPVVTLSCPIGNLAPTQSKTFVIIGKLDPATPVGTAIVNAASASGGELDPNPDNNTSGTNDESTAKADLWIDKVQNYPTGNPSATVIYYLTAYNKPGCEQDDQKTCWNQSGGPSDAQGVVIQDSLPWTGDKFVVQYVSTGCDYDKPSHKVTCTADTLAYGQSASFEIQVKTNGSLGTADNTATVSTSTPDPVAANNMDTVKTTVKGGTGKTGGGGSGRSGK